MVQRSGIKVIDNVRVERIPFIPLFPLGNLAFAKSVEKRISERSVDVVNIHFPAPLIIHTSVPRLLTVHVLCRENSEPLGRGAGIPSLEGLAAPLLGVYERMCLSRYENITAISPSIAEVVGSTMEIDSGEVKVLGGGVDIDQFHPEEHQKRMPYILYTGRLDRGKRVDLLIEAFSMIASKYDYLNLLIVGRGPLEESLRRQAAGTRAGRRISFRGWLTGWEYAKMIREAMIHVNPSPSEGLSNATLEAMSSGVATVVADIKNNTEIVRHAVDGLMFKTGDVHDLADMISTLLENPLMRLKLEENARATCVGRFSWSAVLDRYEDAIASIESE